MSFDLIVLQSGLFPNAAAVPAFLEANYEPRELTRDAAMWKFVSDLEGEAEEWLSGPVAGSDQAVWVNTTWSDPVGHLNAVITIATRHGLAVFDAQQGVLYDPAGSTPLTVTSQGPSLPYISPSALDALIDQIESEQFQWVTIERTPGTYSQVFRHEACKWDVEFRDDTLPEGKQQFTAPASDPTIVKNFLGAWITDAPGWREMLPFEVLEF